MRRLDPEHRGTVAALVVALTIAILLVVLQPGPEPEREVVASAPDPTAAPTTTIASQVLLCNLAQQFVKDVDGLPPGDAARVAEVFFTKAVKLVDPTVRADYDSLARYYTEYNTIGSQYDYDFVRIIEAGLGDRWSQLLFRSPAGVETAERTLAERCKVQIPAPPTIITQPPTTFSRPSVSEGR